MSKSPAPLWAPEFIAFDGEGWDGRYTLLANSALPFDLYDENGLSTRACLEYLTDEDIRQGAALVGFGLSYDFENILRDIPEGDYLALRAGQVIAFDEFTIKYIPRKILEITKPIPSDRTRRVSYFYQDVWGFFQSTFEKALEKWGIEVPKEIKEGKAARGTFTAEGIETTRKYNRLELSLLIQLMNKVAEADRLAFDRIGLRPKHGPHIWYGPGARAANFLKQTDFNKEHPQFAGPAFETLQSMVPHSIKEHPFAAAFYGGRIEAAGIGELLQPLFDYDINSAYPYAITLIPSWKPTDLIHLKRLDQKARQGMYYVEWDIKTPQDFYPFPFRLQSGSVCFPRKGRGWYMSPEVHAAIELFPRQVKILAGFVLSGTDNAGTGLCTLPPGRACTTAVKMAEMAEVRLQAKKEGAAEEKALKLIMNSVYGKTVQQVGKRAFLNFFCGAWITSVCRMKLLRAAAKTPPGSVISIMTDGILSTLPIKVDIGPALGQWEESNFDRVIQLMPGMYLLEKLPVVNPKKDRVLRYRGVGKDFDIEKALASMYLSAEDMVISLQVFVTRSLAIHQYKEYGSKVYQFVQIKKEEKFELSSKREGRGNLRFKLRPFEKYVIFPARRPTPLELEMGSMPYEIAAAPAGLEYDTAKTGEELTADNRIGSILDAEQEKRF